MGVVAKSIDYLYAEFSFSEDWGDGIKTVQFVNSVDNEPYKVILNEDGVCMVPWEVLQYDNSRIKVSAFSGNRITTNEATVRGCKNPDTQIPASLSLMGNRGRIPAKKNKNIRRASGKPRCLFYGGECRWTNY